MQLTSSSQKEKLVLPKTNSILSNFADWRWRLNHLYKIVDKSANKITFQENYIQKVINDNPAPRKVVLKSRQFGVSTNFELILFDKTMWGRNQNNCILAHEQDSIKKLFRIINRAYDFLDERIKPFTERGKGSKYEIYFPKTNSRIYCDMESRSDTIHNLHVSEMAFMKDPQKVMATIEAVPLDGQVFIETTPNGMGNTFYDFWQDTQYEKLFFPWFTYPDYRIKAKDQIEYTEDEIDLIRKAKKYGVQIHPDQITWRRFKIKDLKAMFYQEYPEDDQSCFLTTGNTVLDMDQVQKMFDERRPVLKQENEIKIFEPHYKSRTYVCGADTSEGVKKDSSVAHVFCVETLEQVATFRSKKIKPLDFAHKLKEICEMYQAGRTMMPLLAVERNNHGHAVLQELGNEHINYPNLFKHDDGRAGWNTTRLTRPIMVNAFIDGVDSAKVKLNDEDTLKECRTLINNSGTIEAAPGKHDDCIVAASIALQLCARSQKLNVYKDIGSKIRT